MPVDVEKILDQLEIPFRSEDFTSLEKRLNLRSGDGIVGMAFSKGNDLGILYSKELDDDAKNYVLAHELAHCVLHMEPNSRFHVELKMNCDLYSEEQDESKPEEQRIKQDVKKEVEADEFAAALLLPKDFQCADDEIPRRARELGVSEEIVRFKLRRLYTTAGKGA